MTKEIDTDTEIDNIISRSLKEAGVSAKNDYIEDFKEYIKTRHKQLISIKLAAGEISKDIGNKTESLKRQLKLIGDSRVG
jgi:hypothetical protein